jgi:membrane associated rhomboid family serine protease
MVTMGLAVTNIVIYVVSLIFPVIYEELAFAPFHLLPQYLPLHFYTIFTTMFLHSISDPLHLIMNVLVLIMIGITLERKMGAGKFLATYIISGLIASALWAVVNPLNHYAIGASGAIFGILGALGWLYPRERITIFLGFFIVPNVPAIFAVTIMGGLEVFYAAAGTGNVAHLAHVGGILGGFVMAAIIKSRQSGESRQRRRIAESLISGKLRPLYELYEGQDIEGKNMLARAMDENIPEVKRAWLAQFAEKRPCPKCGEKLIEKEGELRCRKGHAWR